jgi:hypothetical protein
MGHARRRVPSAGSRQVEHGTTLVPRGSPLPARILELQRTAGNRAVAAMLARMPAHTVSDGMLKTVSVYTNGSWQMLPGGTALEVTEPLAWSDGTVHTTAGDAEYWVPIGSLRPREPSGPLAVAIQQYLEQQLIRDSQDTLTALVGAAHKLATGGLDAAAAGAEVAKAAKAIDRFMILEGDARSRAASRGLPYTPPAWTTKMQAGARTLMERLGVAKTMDAVAQAGATREGVGLYRELRAVLELPEFAGLAGGHDASFGAFEGTVASSVAAAPLTDDPDPVLKGGTMLAHDTPVITPGTAYGSAGGETTRAPTSDEPPAGAASGEAVIADKDPWPDVQAPRTVEHVRDDRPGRRSLFIDGRPSADDVMQTGLGDCFYLALVASVADRDPGRILRLLPDSGGATFRATFHFQASKQSTRSIPRVVELPVTLAYNGEDLQGSRFRIVPTGVSRWTRHEGGVREQRLYQTALWAPLMEKAYARFAQEHGIYGQLFGGTGKSGYDVIGDTGGSSHWLASVVYGNDLVERTTHEQMLGAGEPGAEPPSAELVAALARLAGHAKPDETVHLTAGGDEQAMGQQVKRLAAAIMGGELGAKLPPALAGHLSALAGAPVDEAGRVDAAAMRTTANELTDALVYLGDAPVVSQRDATRRHLVVLSKLSCPAGEQDAIAALPAARRALAPGADALGGEAMSRTGLSGGLIYELERAQKEFLAETADDDYTVKRLRKLIRLTKDIPGTMAPDDDHVAALKELRADPRGSHLLELATSLRNKGDSSPDQRFVYGSHAYAVLAADFRDAGGRTVPVSPADAAAALPQLDATKSLVTLRNPHHENQPDPSATSSPGTGQFTLTLAQFARQFDNVREAIVKKT